MHYLDWIWATTKSYAQSSYSVSYVYGKIRGLAQPWISTNFNVQQIEQDVWIGDLASASNIKELKKIGITHIVTAVLGVSPQFPGDFIYLNIPVRDVESEDIGSYLGQATLFIDQALARGGKVLVHCVCGVSRSASIVAAWLMSKNGDGVDETIEKIRKKRECINPNSGFRNQLEEYRSEKKL